MSVTSSAYSRSPPTGMPARDPGDAADLAGQPLVEVHRRRLALERRVGGEDDLRERRPSAAASSTRASSSRIFSRSGPTPSIGEIAPWSTW